MTCMVNSDYELCFIRRYVNGKKHGIQKKYYEDGKLMAEIPYRNNLAMPGLIEYTKYGDPITQFPDMVFKEIDKIAFENKIVLKVYLSDNSKNVDYYRQHVTNNKDTTRLPILDKKGILELDFYVPQGKMIMETVEIIAIKTTSRKNLCVIIGKYNLAAENRLF